MIVVFFAGLGLGAIILHHAGAAIEDRRRLEQTGARRLANLGACLHVAGALHRASCDGWLHGAREAQLAAYTFRMADALHGSGRRYRYQRVANATPVV